MAQRKFKVVRFDEDVAPPDFDNSGLFCLDDALKKRIHPYGLLLPHVVDVKIAIPSEAKLNLGDPSRSQLGHHEF
ncbi:hypothetical protein ACQ4P5_22730 [Ralstonia sp. L16]|uniref:hypothetical protein n=1 Tax=Ralstonia sp. L16 TaxID=3423950 RepID=UPI003F7B1C04